MPQIVQLLLKKEAIANGTGYPNERPDKHVKKLRIAPDEFLKKILLSPYTNT